MRRKSILFLLLSLLAVFAGTMTGCGKEETDPSATEVMKLSLSPEPTPTAAPEDAAPEAVSKKGSVIMINEYLDQKIKAEEALKEAESMAENASDNSEDSKEEEKE